ncbi:hypothetical protein M9H77_08937 [Catharanthus roseus]|uniref:Uncharacterized protein n=1 Tax=Catharanthus roseus TaxID=4058 RepID=A0ACC0BZD5_CATRO|nr:hypothetical protein M9H77_08937 [Catharanthus roseus]
MQDENSCKEEPSEILRRKATFLAVKDGKESPLIPKVPHRVGKRSYINKVMLDGMFLVHSKGKSRSIPILASRCLGLFPILPICKKDIKERSRLNKEEESKQPSSERYSSLAFNLLITLKESLSRMIYCDSKDLATLYHSIDFTIRRMLRNSEIESQYAMRGFPGVGSGLRVSDDGRKVGMKI